MNSIIGLVNRDMTVDPTLVQLKEAGIADERISVLSSPKSINRLIGCDSACVIKNYSVWGAAIGIGIYAIFGVAAALCQCVRMQYGIGYGVGAFIGAVLAGTLVGAGLGVLAGAAEAEKDTHLYLQGVRLGGMVISIQVPDDEIEHVKQILVTENVMGVKVLQPDGV
jgi:hypothetical protein